MSKSECESENIIDYVVSISHQSSICSESVTSNSITKVGIGSLESDDNPDVDYNLHMTTYEVLFRYMKKDICKAITISKKVPLPKQVFCL